MITAILQVAAAALAFYYYLFPHSEEKESAKHQGGLSDVCPKIVAKYIKNVQKNRISFKWN